MTAKLNFKQSASRLAKGQIWKLRHVYIEIVDLSKRLLQYRMLSSLQQKGVRAQSSGIEVMWRYLKTRKAELVEN